MECGGKGAEFPGTTAYCIKTTAINIYVGGRHGVVVASEPYLGHYIDSLEL